MPVWSSTRRIAVRPRLGLLLATLLLAMPAYAKAAGIEIRQADSKPVAGQIQVSAQVDFDLSPEALQALQSGVALHILIEMQAMQYRRWLWNKTVANHTLRFKVQRQALSNHYLVTRLPDGEQQTFLSLTRALDHIGQLRDHSLLTQAELRNEREYYGRLRARLDIESLPAPMQPLAYITSGWRLASSWYQWPIQT